MKKYSLFDMFKGEKEQEQKAKQERKAQGEKNKMRVIPTIALAVANILVLSLDYRVVEAVYSITKNPALALFAIFVSGAMFLLWFDLLYQYKLATQIQNGVALAMSGLSLVTAGYFAFLDYGVSIEINKGMTISMPQNANILFTSMVVLTVINSAMLFYWYMIDEQISAERTVAKEVAKRAKKTKDMEHVGVLLENAEKLLAHKAELVAKFGAQEVEVMLSSIAGIEIDLNGDGVIGDPNSPIPAPAPFVKHEQSVSTPALNVDSGNPTVAAKPK